MRSGEGEGGVDTDVDLLAAGDDDVLGVGRLARYHQGAMSSRWSHDEQACDIKDGGFRMEIW